MDRNPKNLRWLATKSKLDKQKGEREWAGEITSAMINVDSSTEIEQMGKGKGEER